MNRSVVGNQQSHPVAALVEKLVNSIDAILTAECISRDIQPHSSAAPSSMQQAIADFFPVHEGRIQNLPPSARTELAKSIKLIATGAKKEPNYTIIDKGEGQHPDDFPNTFLSLLRRNKTGIRFVQGKFNMGGTGVLQFAGRNSFQLVLSRRHPKVDPAESSDWGFTIIRRLDPTKARPHSTYVYLAPAGKIPRFSSKAIAAEPGSYPDAYGEEIQYGSVIKLWNYKVPGKLKTNLMLDMRRALEKHLPEPALPIRLYERRSGYRAHSYETTLSGLSCVINDSSDDIEPGFDTGAPLNVNNVGPVDIRVTVVKESAIQGSNPKYPKGGVFFIVNGQLHSALDKGFVQRRAKLDYIADTTLVIVDCSELSERIREDLFLGSRDRMRECEERNLLYSAIADFLKDHPGLKKLNARRRQERMAAAISEEETAKIIQELVRTDPSLAELFGKGKKIKTPRGPNEDDEPYVGKPFPSYFKIFKEPAGGLIRHSPRNRRSRITFETDAMNDYFSRAKDPGRVSIQGSPSLASLHLWEGRATLTFELPTNCAVGDILNVEVEVNDVSRVEPFSSSFKIQVEADAEVSPPSPQHPSLGTAFTGLPNITEVRRDDWAKWDFNEYSAIILKSVFENDHEELDIAINLDNLYLQNERLRRRSLDPDLLNYWFKYGLCLLALGMLYVSRKSDNSQGDKSPDVESGPDIFGEIAEASRGLAVTVIPVISQLGKGKIE